MKIKYVKMLLASLTLFSFFISCTKETPELIEEQELITTVVLNFSNEGTPYQTVKWTQNSTENPTITLQANQQYQVVLSFLDESDPADVEDITLEVKQEADVHQIFYEVSSGVSIDFSSAQGDTKDSENNPLLVSSIWKTGASGTGTVRVYLIHEPITKNSTDRNGFGGETDAEVDFNVIIED